MDAQKTECYTPTTQQLEQDPESLLPGVYESYDAGCHKNRSSRRINNALGWAGVFCNGRQGRAITLWD